MLILMLLYLNMCMMNAQGIIQLSIDTKNEFGYNALEIVSDVFRMHHTPDIKKYDKVNKKAMDPYQISLLFKSGSNTLSIIGQSYNADIYIVEESGSVSRATPGIKELKRNSIVLLKNADGFKLAFPNQNRVDAYFTRNDLERFIRHPTASKSLLQKNVAFADAYGNIFKIPKKSFQSRFDRFKEILKGRRQVGMTDKYIENLTQNDSTLPYDEGSLLTYRIRRAQYLKRMQPQIQQLNKEISEFVPKPRNTRVKFNENANTYHSYHT